jgi:hypothetical protein
LGVLPMKIALQYREQARRVYYGPVFEAKTEILAKQNLRHPTGVLPCDAAFGWGCLINSLYEEE